MIMTLLTVVSRFLMKRFNVCALLAMPLLMSACVAGINMIAKDTKPALATKSSKAVLVIVRTTVYHSGAVISNYLDGKLIGQTRGKSYFITDVNPGAHYVIADAGNKDTMRINFEAKRIYFFTQGVFPGYMNPTTKYIPMALADALKEIKEADYLVYDGQHPGKDMSDKDYQDAKKDFDKDNKEDPGRHKDTQQYKGYTRVK